MKTMMYLPTALFPLQRGSALIVSLVILTAITFLALISIQSSSVQLKMVNNSQKSEAVFQSALSELEAQFSESGKTSSAILDKLHEARYLVEIDPDTGEVVLDATSGEPTYQPVSLTRETSGRESITISARFTGRNTINATLNGDISAGVFQYLPFEFSVRSDLNSMFSSDQTLGISRLAPKS